MKKLLTVTVPCYNSAAYMDHCIESLLKGGDSMEILIIDDGSTDDTGKIADTYAEKYPDIVKVIHQENGGHGEGINQGIRNASGVYFKVVDSDDWVDESALKAVLERMERAENEGGLDLIVTNYVYEHENTGKNRTIRYTNVFPKDKAVTWDETHYFLTSQYLTLHSSIFRTDVVRASGVELPKHIFYEDNLFVYVPLPLTKKICYLDVDFYRYFVGREGQSVSEKVLIKRCSHQRQVSALIFQAHDIAEIKKQNPKLGRYMYHNVEMMMILASMFSRIGRSPEEQTQMWEMWDSLSTANPRLSKKLRHFSKVALVTMPGKFGQNVTIFLYKFAHSVVKFN